MYENVTFESILERMLDRIPDDMDKREGSIIYDAIAPAAVELQLMYLELDDVLKQTFADTADREFLILRAKERGLSPKSATYGILKGEFNIDVPIGSRFSCDDLNYIAIEKISDGVFKMQCETIGTVGNSTFGDLIPIDYINGLQTAKLKEILIPGEDEEDTESFRKRYLDSFDAQAFGGNVADYKAKTNAINGVGGVKVTPIWNGGGTVKLTIINSEFESPTVQLIETIQTEIDPTVNQGTGVGLAPIGHTVTVEGVSEKIINVASSFTFKAGYTLETALPYLQSALENYFLDLKKSWDSNEKLIVRISQIEYVWLGLDCVVDLQNTTINLGTSNLQLLPNEVPKAGVISEL